MLHSVAEVKEKVLQGKTLLLAGTETALSQLPTGSWIGGTTPYFMIGAGGICSESQIFVNDITEHATAIEIHAYTIEHLHSICMDTPDNGYSFVIVPAGSTIHTAYAQNAPTYRDAFLKPVVGWVAGVHMSRIGVDQAAVFNGVTAAMSRDQAIVMRVTLPPDRLAELNIVNVFWPGSGDVITFPNLGFEATHCSVNGKPVNFADYIECAKPALHAPLTTKQNGNVINVSIQHVDTANRLVTFYAPVFPGLQYRFANPLPDYANAFDSITQSGDDVVFSCNCILNYLYADLEGKRTRNLTGPITFGEIAHQLLNQTAVQLIIHRVQ